MFVCRPETDKEYPMALDKTVIREYTRRRLTRVVQTLEGGFIVIRERPIQQIDGDRRVILDFDPVFIGAIFIG